MYVVKIYKTWIRYNPNINELSSENGGRDGDGRIQSGTQYYAFTAAFTCCCCNWDCSLPSVSRCASCFFSKSFISPSCRFLDVTEPYTLMLHEPWIYLHSEPKEHQNVFWYTVYTTKPIVIQFGTYCPSKFVVQKRKRFAPHLNSAAALPCET